MSAAHSRLRRVIQPAFALCLLLSGMASAAHAQKQLELLLYTPLSVDGSATTASTTLQLYNPNPGALKYSLSIQNVKAKNTGEEAGWVVAFYGPDNKPAGPLLEGSVAGQKSIRVRVDLSHVVEAGETTAELTNHNVKIADLKLVKDQGLPFKISLQGNPPEKPEIEFVQGTPQDLRWNNDDPMHYPLTWEFFLKGKSVSGTTTLGPNGSTKFSLTPDDGWFSWWQSLFRSETVDGTVTVGYKPAGVLNAYPSKTIPIKARLSYWNPATRDVWGILLILFILAWGAFASSYVNVDLVNRIRAISIRKRIGQLARIIGEIGPQLNSQLRVALWLERDRIKATLPHGFFFTPETAATLAQSNTDTEELTKRVDQATQISDASLRLNHAIEKGEIAPSLTDKVNRALWSAQELLKKSVLSDGEWESIRSLLGTATNTLDLLGKADDELEKTITARLQQLTARFTPAFLSNATCIFIKKRVTIPFGLLSPGGAQLGTQSERDANTRKLAVIADMVLMKVTDPAILGCLGLQDFVSVPVAEQLLRERKESVSVNDLRAEITAHPPQVYIWVDRDTVRANSPILMKLLFNQSRYNQVAAKQRIECTWSFGHDNLTEKGWEVHHYFPNNEKYMVTVTFKDTNQVKIHPSKAIEKEIDVKPQKEERYNHTWVEFQRWAVGLFVAIVGLFAGAKEKILSFDTAGTIMALFLLGFGIDMAKNVLVSKEAGQQKASSGD